MARMSSPRARLAAVVLAVFLGTALAGCSGNNGADEGDPTSGSSTGDTTSGSTGDTTSGSTDSPSVDPNLTYGLDLPAGVHLTPLGSDLTIGQTARVAWQPDKKTVGVLAITVTRLRKGSLKDFAGFTLDDRTKQSTPYYVDAKVRNIGRSDLGGVATPLYLVDGQDVLVEASTFQSTFKPCAAQPLPGKFKAGASTKVCLVYIAADHGTLRAVSFRPTQEYAPIEWTGPLTTPSVKPTKKPTKN
jgi:hypothetical protein